MGTHKGSKRGTCRVHTVVHIELEEGEEEEEEEEEMQPIPNAAQNPIVPNAPRLGIMACRLPLVSSAWVKYCTLDPVWAPTAPTQKWCPPILLGADDVVLG